MSSLSAFTNRVFKAEDGPLTGALRLAESPGLGRLPVARLPDSVTTSVCGFCSTGCGLDIHLREGEAIGLTPAPEFPVNQGTACPKGWEALSVLAAKDRATTPLLRDGHRRLRPVDWHTAMRAFCDRFGDIQQRHGAASVAFLSTGQIPTEEMALLGALAKFGMGMLHGDGNTRQCMATAVTAYKESFGFDAPPYTYADFEESDVIVLIGSNLCIAHPILWQRVLRNPHQPEIIVIDPRRTETAMAATEHLDLRPKGDLVLLYGLANYLISRGWIDAGFIKRHTSGFAEFWQDISEFRPQRVADEAGIDERTLARVAEKIYCGKRVSFWWTMGVNQSYEGVRTAQAIINLALLTGNIGRPGTGANSITGQCNAMGSRLFSNTTCLFGGRSFESDSDRREVSEILNIPVERIPAENSLAYPEIIEGILRGKIKGLWVVATNPAHSWINQDVCREILERLEFLVVQDMYHSTETARMADLLLPAAGWGEKEGTFINSERRIGLIKKVARAPGEALADFSIFKLVAHYWGCGDMLAAWSDPEAVFQILRALSCGQPCDFSGIRDYRMLQERGGIQWPYPIRHSRAGANSAAMGSRLRGNDDSTRLDDDRTGADDDGTGADDETERRLFEDGRFYHRDGKARFIFEQPRKMPEPPSRRFPYLLLTGRGSAAQWHTQTRTAKSPVLAALAPSGVYLEMHEDDARREGISPDQTVVVESQRGRITATAFVTRTVPRGSVFLPMHYEETNRLTHPHFDPYSRQPSYKDCAVRVRPEESYE